LQICTDLLDWSEVALRQSRSISILKKSLLLMSGAAAMIALPAAAEARAHMSAGYGMPYYGSRYYGGNYHGTSRYAYGSPY
jgi:hypothetical protein